MCSIRSSSHYSSINDTWVKENGSEVGKKNDCNYTVWIEVLQKPQLTVEGMFNYKTCGRILKDKRIVMLMQLTAAHHQASGMLLNGVPG